MITKAFIQEQGNGRLAVEEQLVAEEMQQRGIPVSLFVKKRMHRRQLPLDEHSLVVGDVSCISGALTQLQIPVPIPNSYPDCLHHLLYRRVWQSTLSALIAQWQTGHYSAVFAKPCSRLKRFTGVVLGSEFDLSRVDGVSYQDPLLCSEVVHWCSEYRIYVVQSQIRNIHHYEGNPELSVDGDVIQHAIHLLEVAGAAPAGYAIDFGVLTTGQTALVEMNDGFSVGAYGISAQDYTDMIWARWKELLTQIDR